MQVTDVTKEMWVAWKNDPVTIAELKGVGEQRERVKEAIVNAAIKETDALHEAIGYCIGLNELVKVDFLEENENENGPSGMESNSQA